MFTLKKKTNPTNSIEELEMELAEQGNRPMSDARQSVVCINQGKQMKAPGKLFLRPAWQGPD